MKMRGIAFESRSRNKYEIADFLNVTEEYIEESKTRAQSKRIGKHIIYFDPLRILVAIRNDSKQF